jgi:LytS/YehU family sensor histidine kinase
MLLQPLVENAIRHGIEPQVAGGRVEIAAAHAGGALELTVRDTGAGLAETPGGGLGLENVRARLEALFGAAGRLEVAQRAEGGVAASLRIPA